MHEQSPPTPSQRRRSACSTAGCILAKNALQLGRTLTRDAERGRVVGDEEVNHLLRRPYRRPWVHPEPGGARGWR
ncbi:MAG TPA: hypothetical protein VKP69_03170 [Isosphaeraceae bacterium]|nr:hypothetical protein [Isosphaeraceae bacterium]